MFRTQILTTLLLIASCIPVAEAKDLKVLFLGDNGHHKPRERFVQLQPVLAKRGVELVYTDEVRDVNAENLAKYDALLLYANIDNINPPEEKALLDYVASGKGFVPLHCASYCFRNSKDVVALIGAQFLKHETGTFRTELAAPDHPIMKGFGGFESWDETYQHHMHNEKDRTVLEYRREGDSKEPWTWVRTHGKGRVFYTAWGHDHRTWGHPGFQNLVERGIRWAAGDDPGLVPAYLADSPFPIPKMTAHRTDVKPFEYIDVGAKIPNYTPGAQWGTQGEAKSKMQKPLPAEESIKHFVVPEGFHVELFASEPDIGGKPITMAWDEKGRLWIAETMDYPNELKPPGEGRDRIRILEDTDGDWKADKFTVFAENLSIPTTLTFHKGGVIVQDSTRTLYLKDTTGDDKADETTVLFEGWNQGDTHGGVSNFQYGLDNWIWGMQGYNNSRPSVNGEATQSFRQGFFRFRLNDTVGLGNPDGKPKPEIEFIRSTNNNTWGLGISEEGIIFGSTANHCPSVYMPIPNRYYERVRGWTPSLVLEMISDTHLFNAVTENVRQVDHHGGYTAGAGHALYTARKYPKEYWNRTAFVAEPTGHLVGTFILNAEGSDFHSKNPFNLIGSHDEWSAPIMAEVGPDGNVWVIDWYNYIVQHNPTPRGFQTGKGNAYETDLRDKKHGRIYRVVYGDEKDKPFTLENATPEKLVETLKHPTMLWRKHAQRLLVEGRGFDAIPALIKLAGDQTVDEIGLNVGAIHALWTLHGLRLINGFHPEVNSVALANLKHPSAGVRRNALQVLQIFPQFEHYSDTLLQTDLLNDADAQVRLVALLTLSDLPPVPAAGPAILKAMTDPMNAGDRWIQDAAISAAATNADSFLKAVAQADQKPDEKLLESVGIVAEHYGRGGPVDSVVSVVSGLSKSNPQVAEAILLGIAKGWPNDKAPKIDEAFEANLKQMMTQLPPASRGVLLKLAIGWGSKEFESYAKEVSDSLLAQIDDEELALEKRIQAARQLVEFRSQEEAVIKQLLGRITPQTPPELAVGLVQALVQSESNAVGTQLAERFAGMTPQTRAAGITVLLSRPDSTRSLLDAIDKGTVQLSELSLDQKEALTSHPSRSIQRQARELLSRGGALPNPDRQKVLEGMLALTEKKGDPKEGKLVFTKQCSKCHMHSGEGTKIGPDLTGMAVHPKAELLTHIIDPSRDVEGNFRVYTVLTADGLVMTGLLASESKTAIELFDVEGKKKVVLREDIEEMQASRKSLMPEGFEKQVPQEDIVNLLEFLTQRGKFLPLDLRKVATIASDRGMFFSTDGDVERLIFEDWSPKTHKGVPFNLIDPSGGKTPNAIMLFGPIGGVSRTMPKSVTLPTNGPARAIHLLGLVSGWGFPYDRNQSVSMIVRLHYVDGQTEDHELRNGVHFADYIRRVDVPGSEFAFAVRNQQVRYLAVLPKRSEPIEKIEFQKGPDQTAPVIMAVTLESLDTPKQE